MFPVMGFRIHRQTYRILYLDHFLRLRRMVLLLNIQ
uniref:Uncharacterized protein n=1 Tax=virus sp. ctx9V1 TaxID=2828001 RepID=A0A8S5RE62_9VIRU|nr:MAG TPA: hypothetical protein [virus sp. ctx9V1]